MSAESSPSHDERIAALREIWLTDNDLSFLRELDITHLARIHAEVEGHARRVQEAQYRLFAVLAGGTRFVPNFVITRMSGALSPYVIAQVSQHLEPKAAAGLAKTFDPHLLGEVVVHIDTHTAASIAVHMEVDMLAQIMNSLANKGLMKRLGEVSDALEEKMLEKLVLRLKDPERIAAVASHMQNLIKLVNVARKLDRRLVHSVIEVLERAGNTRVASALR